MIIDNCWQSALTIHACFCQLRNIIQASVAPKISHGSVGNLGSDCFWISDFRFGNVGSLWRIDGSQMMSNRKLASVKFCCSPTRSTSTNGRYNRTSISPIANVFATPYLLRSTRFSTSWLRDSDAWCSDTADSRYPRESLYKKQVGFLKRVEVDVLLVHLTETPGSVDAIMCSCWLQCEPVCRFQR